MTGSVGSVKAEGHNVRSKVEIGHVQSGQSAVEVVQGQSIEEDRGDEPNKNSQNDPQSAELLVGEVGSTQEYRTVKDITGQCLYNACALC